jgi:hypothetical protein
MKCAAQPEAASAAEAEVEQVPPFAIDTAVPSVTVPVSEMRACETRGPCDVLERGE